MPMIKFAKFYSSPDAFGVNRRVFQHQHAEAFISAVFYDAHKLTSKDWQRIAAREYRALSLPAGLTQDYKIL